jgi:CelD/BcsL family acetyltransferase involved in cellulose biosynthesis
MRTDTRRPIAVALDTAPALPELEPAWRRLEDGADASFFSSWSWIGCWLASLKSPLKVLLMTATRDTEVVGLGIFVAAKSKRLRLLPTRLLALHATGNAVYDTLTVEHNDFLVAADCADDVRTAMFDCLFKNGASWDQLLLPGLSQKARPFVPAHSGVNLRERSNPCHLIDLKPLHGRDDGYLGQLKSNTRQQIRRSMKAYREVGPLELTAAADSEMARRFLDRLQTLHQSHWVARGGPGAFANPYFVDFHRNLIDNCFKRGEIQLLRISVGDADLGYLYNFVHRGRVLFYQSGFDYQLIEKHGRPGLVAHALAVEHNAHLGHHTYDLLAGSARYKRSLASHSESMSWVVLHRDTLAFRLEEFLRRCKRFVSRDGAAQPEAVDGAEEH